MCLLLLSVLLALASADGEPLPCVSRAFFFLSLLGRLLSSAYEPFTIWKRESKTR